ncbi:MAG: pseudouridine-5'-phosphate glycosidase, partial [Chloroflexi bacterium]|nr:pseudouridine-5'-phosphate glycosidase [Chloroflexota bacterium]
AGHLPVEVSPEVAEALERRSPIVALESAFLSHGLPIPDNIETAIAMQEAIRAEEAISAMVGLADGRFKVGLNTHEIEEIGRGAGVEKINYADLVPALTNYRFGGTTVSATVYIAHRSTISIVVTGGIGGVHVGSKADISSDLTVLAQTPLVLICSGAKTIVDIPATYEWLETHGISVIGYKTDQLPAFYMGSSGISLRHWVADPEMLVDMIRHWRWLGLEQALLVAVPVPWEAEVAGEVLERALAEALREAEGRDIRGVQLTPFLLAELNRLTQGATLRANRALLVNNARVAAQIAVALGG